MIGLLVIFSLIGSVLSLIGGVLLLAKKEWSQETLHTLISFAAGVLLTVSFADLLPKSIEIAENIGVEPNVIFLWVLGAITVLFLFERSFVWFHCHHTHCEDRHDAVIPLLWFGDTLHNFLDGVVITASFLVSVPFGITASLAVAAHEVPQEIADFSLFLSKGFKAKSVLLLNLVSALATPLASLLTYFFWGTISPWQPQLLAVTAGMFIYIASSDLIPELHHEYARRRILLHSSAFVTGIFTIFLLGTVLP